MAVIISSHKNTVAMMNSIHSLLSENHPYTLFMASLLFRLHGLSLNLICTYANSSSGITVPHVSAFLSGRVHRAVPSHQTDKLSSGRECLHEIKHDGFRVIARQKELRVR